MSTTVEQIKNRLSIADVVGSYITLEKSGANLKARCPFHNEKTPSFFVSPDRNTYYCFGCGAKGDIFSFVEEFESLDFVGALKVLADRAGVALEEFRSGENKTKNENERVFSANEEAAIFFQKRLSEEKSALLYLKKRGLQIDTVRSWRIGYAPLEWRLLKDHLKSKGFSEIEILKAGLIKNGEKVSYDRFRGRIMFPIFDSSARVIGFSGRILVDKASQNGAKVDSEIKEPKYLNSPETPIFDKSKILYGMHKAKYAIKEKGSAVLVEGQVDLLMSHQAGFPHTIASSGTALTENHVSLIRRYSDTLVIAYDSDRAGQNASLRAWQIALLAGIQVKVVLLANESDPADTIKADPLVWKSSLEKAVHIIDYYMQIFRDKSGKEREALLEDSILPLIASVAGSSGKSKYVTRLSFETGIPESQIWEDLSKIDVVAEDTAKAKVFKKNINDSLKKVLALIFLLKKKDGSKGDSFLENVKRVLPNINDYLKENEENKEVLIFEAEAIFGNQNSGEAEKELLYYLEDDILKDRFTKTMYALKIAEGANIKEEIDKNTKLLDHLSKQMNEMRNLPAKNL